MATAKQITANQQNAQRSTGAVTEEGKAAVSKNSTKHGILSNRLLDHENPDEYQALLDSLLTELHPVGTLEFALVEKIAIILWRQRRLVQAETAEISLQQTTKSLLEAVSKVLGRGYSDRLTESDLEAPDDEQLAWCADVLAEIDSSPDWQDMKKTAPLCWGQLVTEAKEDGDKPEDYHRLLVANGISEWVYDLKAWCGKELKKAADAEKTKQLMPTVMDKQSVLQNKAESFLKYQGSLDNQLYKVMKALREQQQYRLQSIDTAPIEAVS